MGLDMYLYADRFINEYFQESDKEKAAKIQEMFPELGDFDVKTIRVEVAYWRKANAIHKWFVDNVQEGNDNCGTYYVSREQLQELLTLIEEVLKAQDQPKGEAIAKEKLPTTSGFFFGGTDIDAYYYDDLTYTVEKLKKALSLSGSLDFYYHSSW